MTKIVITSPVEHDGKPLAEGKTYDLPAEAAEALIGSGTAEAVVVKGKAQAAEPSPEA